MFDVNQAPLYQSFIEVVVEPSAGRVHLRPHGIRGRLRRSDLQTASTLKPSGVPDDAFVEWTVETPGADVAGK